MAVFPHQTLSVIALKGHSQKNKDICQVYRMVIGSEMIASDKCDRWHHFNFQNIKTRPLEKKCLLQVEKQMAVS
jgi:hypothetical protein